MSGGVGIGCGCGCGCVAVASSLFFFAGLIFPFPPCSRFFFISHLLTNSTNLSALLCCVNRYLYTSFPLGETQAKFSTRSGALKKGTLLAMSTEVGVASLDGCDLATFERIEEGGGAGGGEGELCVLRWDGERGVSLPEFVGSGEARFVSHLAGVKVGEPGAADRIEELAADVLRSSSVLTARRIVLDYMVDRVESEEQLADVFCNSGEGGGKGWEEMVNFVEIAMQAGGEGERKMKACLLKWWRKESAGGFELAAGGKRESGAAAADDGEDDDGAYAVEGGR